LKDTEGWWIKDHKRGGGWIQGHKGWIQDHKRWIQGHGGDWFHRGRWVIKFAVYTLVNKLII
jgi:hypothetical protein